MNATNSAGIRTRLYNFFFYAAISLFLLKDTTITSTTHTNTHTYICLCMCVCVNEWDFPRYLYTCTLFTAHIISFRYYKWSFYNAYEGHRHLLWSIILNIVSGTIILICPMRSSLRFNLFDTTVLTVQCIFQFHLWILASMPGSFHINCNLGREYFIPDNTSLFYTCKADDNNNMGKTRSYP